MLHVHYRFSIHTSYQKDSMVTIATEGSSEPIPCSALIHMPYKSCCIMMTVRCATPLGLMPKSTSLVSTFYKSNKHYILPSYYSYLGLFYYVLGNIHPRLRAGLQCIQLVAVVKTSHITSYGIDKVLQPFMEDVQLLEKVTYPGGLLFKNYFFI